MIQETIGIDRCEELINKLLTAFLDGEQVLNERAPSSRPKDQPYTGFMVFWAEGHAHVYKPTFYDEATKVMTQDVTDDVYVTARVICYGKDSMKRVMSVRSLLNSDVPVIQVLRQELGICDIDDAQAIPEPGVNGTVRERAYINFKFYARVTHQFDIDFFDRVTVVTSVPELSFTKTDELKIEET
jgi:hypothetical protein